ncbi:MAG: LiaF transmembrane domain-containing protein [Bacillota bacterium]
MKQKRWLGIFLVLVGVFIILNNIGLIEMGLGELLATYWPLLLIFAGGYNLVTNPAGRWGGVIVLLIGAFFLINNLDYIEASEYISFWPVVLILIGISLLLRSRDKANAVNKDSLNIISLFAGTNNKVISKNFKGGSSISLFGGADIDFKEAKLSGGEAQLDVFVLFGGADIYVPADWQVVIKGLPIFGGWDNKTKHNREAVNQDQILTISCLTIFGGIDVKN